MFGQKVIWELLSFASLGRKEFHFNVRTWRSASSFTSWEKFYLIVEVERGFVGWYSERGCDLGGGGESSVCHSKDALEFTNHGNI